MDCYMMSNIRGIVMQESPTLMALLSLDALIQGLQTCIFLFHVLTNIEQYINSQINCAG